MKVILTPAMEEVIGNWIDDGATVACANLDRIEDAILDEGGELTSDEKLSLIREVRILKKELSVFAQKGGITCS